MKSLRVLALVTVALVALSGCTGFQKSGEVTVGLEVGEISPVDFAWTPSAGIPRRSNCA